MSSELFHTDGRRKYLTKSERDRFLEACEQIDREARTFCMTLCYSGCRISEGLQLVPNRIDADDCTLTFESLKKRKRGIYRSVPVPKALIDALDLVHGIRRSKGKSPLWTFDRTTAWRRVSEVMKLAGIEGPQASPKGLRHGFGVAAVQSGIPLNMLRKWLGHSDLKTTSIYADAIGAEERDIASRMWS